MKRLAWLTDIHLNFVPWARIASFCEEILNDDPDVVLISGDIGEAPSLRGYLRALEDQLQRPIYFVLGNHDFYRGSIAGVRTDVAELVAQSPWLHYLPLEGVVELTSATSLIGHDGWGDGRLGNFQGTDVFLSDFQLIRELTWLTKDLLLERLQQLGDEAAMYLAIVLPEAVARSRQVILLTHVPPFQEASWYDGHICTDDWLPFFSCKAVGDVLFSVMQSNPSCQLTVLCGHTHGGGVADILPNLKVMTGPAVYEQPTVQEVLKVE